MDSIRAKEIAASPIMAHVTYNNNQVYIESVNENKSTANIHMFDQPDNRMEVPLNNLLEK